MSNTKQQLFVANTKNKVEICKNGFFSMGVTLYNELPIKTFRKESSGLGKKFIYVNKVILWSSFSFIYQKFLAEAFLFSF